MKEEKVKLLVKLFVSKLQSSVKETRHKKKLSDEIYDNRSVTNYKTIGKKKQSGIYNHGYSPKNSEQNLRASASRIFSKDLFDSVSRHSVADGNETSGVRDRLTSPTKGSGAFLARPLQKRSTVLQASQFGSRAKIAFGRFDAKHFTSAKFVTVPKPKAKLAFKIFPQAMEHDLQPIEKPHAGNINRHKSQGLSVASVQGNSESEGKTNFSSHLGRLLLNTRIKHVKDRDQVKTEKQLAIESVLSDRALTPCMQRRKIDHLEQLFSQQELEKKQEKEAKKTKELDDALTGKR